MSGTKPLVALLLAAASTLLAADFWTSKKFTEWSGKEVQQMTNNSPWAQMVSVPLGGGGGAGEIGGGGGGKKGGRGGGRGGGGLGADDDTGGGLAAPAASSTVSLVIRWHSALPIRQALARARWGAEAATSPDAAKLLAGQDEFYILAIRVPVRMLGADPEKAASASVLKIGKGAPFATTAVQLNRGQPFSELYLAFPRAGHAITLEDKEVELTVALGRLQAKKKFQLKSMVFEGKLDL
jgi:hypothetical protein